jgi:phosphoglycerate-specific signal transduction histidine kinase
VEVTVWYETSLLFPAKKARGNCPVSRKQTYAELEDRVSKLEKEIVSLRRSEEALDQAQGSFDPLSPALSEQTNIEKERLEGVIEMAGAVCLELNQPLQALYFQCERLQKAISEDNILFNQIDWIVKKIDKMSEIVEKLRNIGQYQTKDYIEGTRIVDIDRASRPD